MTDVLKVAATRALNGESVILCGHNRTAAINMLNQVERQLQAKTYTRYRTHGMERIETTNCGTIGILTPRGRASIRGNQITYMVLDNHRPLLDPEFTEEILPAFQHSPRIAVIG